MTSLCIRRFLMILFAPLVFGFIGIWGLLDWSFGFGPGVFQHARMVWLSGWNRRYEA